MWGSLQILLGSNAANFLRKSKLLDGIRPQRVTREVWGNVFRLGDAVAACPTSDKRYSM